MKKQQYCFHGNGYNLAKVIQRLLGHKFTQSLEQDGIEFVHSNGRRIMKLVDDDEKLIAFFDVPIPDIHKEDVQFTHEDINGVHKDTWIYEGDSVSDLVALVEIAIENFSKHYH